MHPQNGILPKYVFQIGAAPSKKFSWLIKNRQNSLFLKFFSQNILQVPAMKTRVLKNFFLCVSDDFPQTTF